MNRVDPHHTLAAFIGFSTVRKVDTVAIVQRGVRMFVECQDESRRRKKENNVTGALWSTRYL